ncbi:MAG: type II secretion system protein GspG [Thermodesulfovibrionales bacterium]|jgi:general secretion pathway protein G
MKSRRERGFTLVEVIVVAGIIAILAGILVPLIISQIDQSRTTRAAADVRSISNAMIIFRKDTGQWPNLVAGSTPCGTGVTLLVSGDGSIVPTTLPTGWSTTNSTPFINYLSTDTTGCYSTPITTTQMWKGAYMGAITNDPWGNPYVTNADAFNTGNPVWILSAGPNGVYDTPATAGAPVGDDIGIRLQ